MTTFGDYKKELRASMAAPKNNTQEQEKVKDMTRATQNLRQTSMANSQTIGSLSQTMRATNMQIQMQNQQITMLTSAIRSMMTQNVNPPMPAPVAMGSSGGFAAPIGGMGRQAMGVAGGVLMGTASSIYSQAQPVFHSVGATATNLRAGNAGTHGHGIPGHVEAPQTGLISSIMHGSGATWNSADARSYTKSAYQRAMARSTGNHINNSVQGLASGAMGLAGAMGKDLVGGFLGQMAIPIPMVGAMIGSELAQNLPDPLTYGAQELGRASAFAGAAQRGSHKILRGRRGAESGNFDISESTRIGSQIRKDTVRDFTYSTEEIGKLQQGFANSGHMLGGNTPQKYADKFKKLLDTHKVVAKTLQLSTEEAIEAMKTMDYQLGLSSNKTAGISSTSNLTGMNPQTVMARMMSGAQSGISKGLMAGTGARTARGGLNTAGVIMSRGRIDGGLLSTIGGEQGLAGIIEKSQQNFLAGSGGVMMAAGGSGSMSSGFGAINKSLQGSGDLLDFVAEKHRRIDDKTSQMGSMGVQTQQATMIYSMAKQMFPKAKGKRLKNVMIMLAKGQFGLSSSEAEALVESFKSIRETANEDMRLQSQAQSDMRNDLVSEQFSLTNRAKLFGREAFGAIGGNAVVDGVGKTSAEMGEYAETQMEHLQDYLSGVTRTQINEGIRDGAVAKNSSGRLKSDFITSRSIMDGSRANSSQLKNARRLTRGGTRAGKFAKSILNETSSIFPGGDLGDSIAHSRKKSLMQALSEGVEVNSKEDLDAFIEKKRNTRGSKFLSDKEYRSMITQQHQMGNMNEDSFKEAMGRFARPSAKGAMMSEKGSIDSISNFLQSDDIMGTTPAHRVKAAFTDRMYQDFVLALKDLQQSIAQHGETSEKTEAIRKRVERLHRVILDDGTPAVRKLMEATLESANISFTEKGEVDFTEAMDFESGAGEGFLKRGKKDIKKMFERHTRSQTVQAQRKFLKTGLSKMGLNGFASDTGVDVGDLGSVAMNMSESDISQISDKHMQAEFRKLRSEAIEKGLSTEEAGELFAQRGVELGATSGDVFGGNAESANMIGTQAANAMIDYFRANTDVLTRLSEELKE